MKKTTFWDIIDKTLEAADEPLSTQEIWDKANELGITENFTTTGKTPRATIGAYLYTDISRGGSSSKYIQTSERPAQFFLRNKVSKIDLDKIIAEKEVKSEKEEKKRKQFKERDLHPLLVTYAKTDTHIRAYLKTIFHESSKKTKKGLNEWLHPDLVGVYFPYSEYTNETLEIQKELAITSIKLFSFEMKIKVTFSNLREYYFQAVSNSSWANEGYLVALHLEDDSALMDEIRRLNNAFGIGVIKLNPESIYESTILFPARVNPEIDWDTANRLAKENKDFNAFLRETAEDIKLGKVKSSYDEIMTPEDIEKYIINKKIV